MRMLNVISKIVNRNLIKIQQNNVRQIQLGRKCLSGAYEAEGKTTLNILNSESDHGLMINGVSQVGFRLNNDMTILGPMIIFPRTVLSWDVEDKDGINEESLSLFSVLEPKIDLLVLGVGDPMRDTSFQTKMFPLMKKLNINFEILPTEQACATFNFLNSEGRYIAGAFIPPTQISSSEDDELQTKLRYQNLYQNE